MCSCSEKGLLSLINAFTYQGKTYGIPKDFNTLGLVYNKDLFKAAGVAEPTNDWTWTDLQTAAKKLTSGSVVGLSLPADANRYLPFLWQAGGEVASINSDKAVAGAVISLGQKLNLRVIAEGVETAEQVEFLRANNCDEIQGYYFSKPVGPGRLAQALAALSG